MGLSSSQEINSTVEKQLQRIQEVSSSSSSVSHKRRLIASNVSSWQSSFRGEPVLVLFPHSSNEDSKEHAKNDYVFLQAVLLNGSHVIYIYQPCGKGHGMIIESLRPINDNINGDYDKYFNQILKEIKENSEKLDLQMDDIAIHSSDRDVKNSVEKVRKLVNVTPGRMNEYSAKAKENSREIESLNMANIINNYLKFATSLTESHCFDIKMNGDILHSVTGQVLDSLRL